MFLNINLEFSTLLHLLDLFLCRFLRIVYVHNHVICIYRQFYFSPSSHFFPPYCNDLVVRVVRKGILALFPCKENVQYFIMKYDVNYGFSKIGN